MPVFTEFAEEPLSHVNWHKKVLGQSLLQQVYQQVHAEARL